MNWAEYSGSEEEIEDKVEFNDVPKEHSLENDRVEKPRYPPRENQPRRKNQKGPQAPRKSSQPCNSK